MVGGREEGWGDVEESEQRNKKLQEVKGSIAERMGLRLGLMRNKLQNLQ